MRIEPESGEIKTNADQGGCITFPRPVTIPWGFLTLCAGGKYTSKFEMLPESRQWGLMERIPKPAQDVGFLN